MASFFDCYVGGGDAEEDAPSSSSGESNSESSESEPEEPAVGAAEAGKAADVPTSVLPSFDDAFSAIDGPPGFLDPEATRPVAENLKHLAKAVPAAGSSGQQGGDGDGFDVAALAPKLGKKYGGPGDRKGGVIEAKAKIYTKPDQQGTATGEISAFAIAMMGGNVDNMVPKDDAPAKRKQPSAAMGVQEFLEKGTGGALLPRKRQDRKDKEKSKRQMGQSSIGEWKTEAEMVLRQQYD